MVGRKEVIIMAERENRQKTTIKTSKARERMRVVQDKMSEELREIRKKAPIGVGPNVQMTI